MEQSFSKEERLIHQKNVKKLFQEGVSLLSYPCRLIYSPYSYCQLNTLPRILFSVSKRKIKLSVKRNKIKRRMKESYRLNRQFLIKRNSILHKTPKFIAIMYISTELESHHSIKRSFFRLFQKIN